MIAHDYAGLQIHVLYSFVVSCVSTYSYNAINARLKFCVNNRRKIL